MAKTLYQKLEYLDNGNVGNVIDINLANTGIYGFDITCSFPVATSPKAALWGHRSDTTTSNCYKFYPFYTATSFGYQSGSTYYSLTSHTIELDAKYRFIARGGSLRPKGYQFYKNDVQFYSAEKTFITTTNAKGAHLYASNDSGNFKHPIRARIYNAKFYLNFSNTTIGRDLIPAKRISDGVCGLFDIISKEFYTSLSDSTKYEFTGPELNEYFDENYNSEIPATLEQKLEHINETKNLIKEAIINKGIEVSDEDTFRSYVEKINGIKLGVISQEEYDTCLALTEDILLPPIPDYTPLTVIHNDSKSYIDTGINPYSKNLRYEFKFGPILGGISVNGSTYTSLPTYVFGGKNTTDNKNLGTLEITHGRYGSPDSYINLYAKQSGKIANNINSNNGTGYSSSGLEGFFEIKETTFSYSIYDSNKQITYEGSGNVSGEFPQTPTITLFCQNTENGVDTTNFTRASFYYFKIYLDDKLVRDFIPVKDGDGVVCLYDTVSRTLFYAQNGNLHEGGV